MLKADRMVAVGLDAKKRKALSLLLAGASRRDIVAQTDIGADALRQIALDFGLPILGRNAHRHANIS